MILESINQPGRQSLATLLDFLLGNRLTSSLIRLFQLMTFPERRGIEVDWVRDVARDDLDQSAVGEGGALPLGQGGPRDGGCVGSQLQNSFVN